jgi:hypothetical protein
LCIFLCIKPQRRRLHQKTSQSEFNKMLSQGGTMKPIASTLMFAACLGASSCAFAQGGGTAAPAPGTAAAPTAPTTTPSPTPNSTTATGQNNNPSAIPPNPPSPATPATNGNMPIGPQNPQTPLSPQVPPTVGTTAPIIPAPGSVNTASGSGQVFTTLDRSQKGYLSAADVASNKFLAGHFQQCDSNTDGRLTQAETNLCMQQMPAGEK